MIYYILSTVLVAVYLGIFMDATKSILEKLYLWNVRMDYPKWLRNDWLYLVMGCTIFLNWACSIQFAHFQNLVFLKHSVIGLILASLGWDYAYGILVYKDAFAAFKIWAFNWGFKTKTERLIFDLIRYALAIFIIFLGKTWH